MTMPTRTILSSFISGYETYDKAFLLNNDAFPILENALCWRKQLIKRQCDEQIGRLRRTNTAWVTDVSGNATITLSSTGISIQSGLSQFFVGSTVFVDVGSGVLVAHGGTGSATLNLTTTILTITGASASTQIYYYPGLPVLGIESFGSNASVNTPIDFPTNVFFDQNYSYQFDGNFYDVSFYKVTGTSVTWHGGNYQQFFSSNYYRSLFSTNNNPGIQIGYLSTVSIAASAMTFKIYKDSSRTVPITNLLINDWIWFNEVQGTVVSGIDMVSAQVTNNASAASGTYTVTFTSTINLTGYTANSGIGQIMTNQIIGSTGDGIRWYDGFGTGFGWVNFAPPLDDLQNSSTTYLMGCKIIIPYGNRLLAIGTFEATSSNASTPTYYGNRIRYCEVTATPFYSLPVPNTISSTQVEPNAWVSNIQGFGGFIDLDTPARIISAEISQGALILGTEIGQKRVDNTGVEIEPFSIQTTNPEYGTSATYSSISTDQGVYSVGEYGLLISSSYGAQRIDPKIIDQIFSVNAQNNGFDRISAARDFENEVIYFTYVSDDGSSTNVFPNRSIVFNYREGNFAIWKESYTTYGLYKVFTGQTWGTYDIPWEQWDEKWEDLGGFAYQEPFVAAGTSQGFVMQKWTNQSRNDPSMIIQSISANANKTYTITSPYHNLEDEMYIGFWNTSASDTQAQFIGQINSTTQSTINVTFSTGATPGNIVPGLWMMSRFDLLNVWTKQFPSSWSIAKKTRIGAQKYFLDKTSSGEFTVNIYGSQSSLGLNNDTNSSSIFSNTVRTRPDNSLGINAGQSNQSQIWHRLSCSAIGDTIQLQFTMSQEQMFDINIASSPWVLHAAILDLYPSRILI